MRYWPRHKTMQEIIVAAGFTHTGPGMGWEKPRDRLIADGWIPEGRGLNTARLHAFIHENNINLHLDKIAGPNKHETLATHYLVARQMKQFSRIDWPEPLSPFYPQLRVWRWFAKFMPWNSGRVTTKTVQN